MIPSLRSKAYIHISIRFLQHSHTMPCLPEIVCRGETADAAADNEEVQRYCSLAMEEVLVNGRSGESHLSAEGRHGSELGKYMRVVREAAGSVSGKPYVKS